jgi:hypothetical protein
MRQTSEGKMPKRSRDVEIEAVRLSGEQIAAAQILHASLEEWHTADKALSRLRETLPGFGPTESLLKVVVVNALYRTNVLALARAAKHVESVLGSIDLAISGPSLVELLAEIPTTPHGRRRRFISFASKFAHFFCDPERYPIYDSYALSMVMLHLGSAAESDPARPYQAFIANLNELKRQYGLMATFRELDRYLWIAGQYRAYIKGYRQLNGEVLQVFAEPTAHQRVLLRKLTSS